MGTKTILDFASATTPLASTDVLYILQGSGTDRDKQTTLQALQDVIGDALLVQSTTASIDLSTYNTNLVVYSDPAGAITLTFSGALPAGKRLFIYNVSTNVVTTSIESLSLTLVEKEYQDWYSDGTNMLQLQNIFTPRVFKKKHIVFADSPYTVSDDENYDLYTFDDSGGAIVFNLPTLSDNYNRKIPCKKIAGDNTVTLTREGSDNILGIGLATIVLAGSNEEVTLYGDEDTTAWEIENTNLDFYVKVSDAKSSGTDGGSFTSGAWQTRDINTEDNDDQNIASISSNQITLEAGTYYCIATSQGYKVDNHRLRIQDVDNTITLLIGLNALAGASDNTSTNAIVSGKFTLSAQTTIEIQHRCITTNAKGFGDAENFGVDEIYTVAEFWRK